MSSCEGLRGLKLPCEVQMCLSCARTLLCRWRRRPNLSARSRLYSAMYSSHCFTASSYYRPHDGPISNVVLVSPWRHRHPCITRMTSSWQRHPCITMTTSSSHHHDDIVILVSLGWYGKAHWVNLSPNRLHILQLDITHVFQVGHHINTTINAMND